MKHYLQKLWSRYLDYQEKRAAYVTLTALPDRLLRDMGVSRAELHYKVFHGGENEKVS